MRRWGWGGLSLGCLGLLVVGFGAGCGGGETPPRETASATTEIPDTLRMIQEIHLRNVRQLTDGGENAEGYFSPDGTELVFQSTRGEFACDQIFRMGVDGSNPTLVSTGQGRTTCSYFLGDGATILYASTHLASPDCPPPPDYSQGYVWALYPGFDLFLRSPAGDLTRLTDTPGYDAEATVSAQGDQVVFTSLRSGDLDLYRMNPDGTGVRQLTSDLGYEGGGFFSPDGKEIVFRAYYPGTPEEISEYQALLGQNLIRPSVLNLYIMDADGQNRRLVLENGAANFAPYFFPDGERIIFASNLADPGGRNFDLFMIRRDGTGLERVTYHESFDGFPMFSPDGSHLVFASNRNHREPNETNLFIAEWVD